MSHLTFAVIGISSEGKQEINLGTKIDVTAMYLSIEQSSSSSPLDAAFSICFNYWAWKMQHDRIFNHQRQRPVSKGHLADTLLGECVYKADLLISMSTCVTPPFK